MSNVFATATVIGGRQLLCFYESQVEQDGVHFHRATVMAYDASLALHMRFSMDFGDSAGALNFVQTFKTDDVVRADCAAAIERGFQLYKDGENVPR